MNRALRELGEAKFAGLNTIMCVNQVHMLISFCLSHLQP